MDTLTTIIEVAVGVVVVYSIYDLAMRHEHPEIVAARNRGRHLQRLRRSMARLANETDDDYERRVNTQAVVRFGLPRAEHVAAWLREGRRELVPPRQIVEWTVASYAILKGLDHPDTRNAIALQGLLDWAEGSPLDAQGRQDLERLRRLGISGEAKNIEDFADVDWLAEDAALKAGAEPPECPQCLRRGFYAPRFAAPNRRYRACKFCGFWQDVGKPPQKIVRFECHHPDGTAVADWKEPTESWTCPKCRRAFSPGEAVPWPADNPSHSWNNTPQRGSQADYVAYWETQGVKPPTFGIL